MEGLRDSTAVIDSATIPGPYVSPERTESIPLKGTSASSSSSFLKRCCRNCLGFADDDAGDGLKFIIVTFFILSAAVTVALVAQIYHGDYQVVPHGSVATDSTECSIVGSDILKKKGNAVDAAVASTLCMGVVNPHITGLGGGGFILVYDHRRSEVIESRDFREAAPQDAKLPAAGTLGPLTVGVPGIVKGLFAAHQAHGKLSWKEVVAPAADIARSGFPVPSSLVAARAQLAPRTDFNTMLHDLMDSLEAGQSLKLPLLASTLDLIGSKGPDVFYNGSISKQILSAVKGSTLTSKDLLSYRSVQREPLHGNFAGFNIIVPGAPSGGPLLLAALDGIAALNLSQSASEEPSPLFLYRLAQSIQQNYAGFFAESGDPDFSSLSSMGFLPSSLPETVASHVAAVDLNDLYVSIVSGHNSLFGSQILTDAGFILNNALASFDASSSNLNIQGSAFENLYPPKGDTNSTIIIPKFGALPDRGTVQDHGSKEVPESDQHRPPSWNQEQNFSRAEKTLGREKRSEAPESGPRAAIWGSSVANNGLVGGKRPISLSTPIIAVEIGQICGRRLVLGGSDAGTAAQVLSQLLVLDGNITSSIEAPRVKLSPTGSTLSLEQWYAARLSPAKRQQLTEHGLQMQSPAALNPSVNIVEKIGDALSSHSDSRGEGVASRF